MKSRITGTDRGSGAAWDIDQDDALHKQYKDSVVLLTAVRSSLADLLDDVMNGNAGALRDLVAKQGDLESALKRVFEAESRFHEWQSRNSGGLARDEIDFDVIRDEIGCRLHRLRTCCQSD